MATRDELHQLIDTLPEGLVDEVLNFAQFVAKKVVQRQLELPVASIKTAGPGSG